MPMKTRDWSEIVDDDLRDQRFAAAYLQECLEDGVETFLVALRDVARANGGIAGVAKTAEVRRESVYRALSRSGNPEFRTVDALVRALGLRITLAPQPDSAAGAAGAARVG
jgi:probable addiction module antidote protein